MLLAIDTATHMISLALHDGRDVLAEQTWRTENQHSVELAPAVQTMMKRVSASVSSLTLLAVSIGPGSYSGLRIGVALAKGLASVGNLPVVGVSSLDILAAAHPADKAALYAVVQAGRGRIVVGSYRAKQGRWHAQGEPALYDWETLLTGLEGSVIITGEIDQQGSVQISAAQERGTAVNVASGSLRLRRAGILAEEALVRYNTATDKQIFGVNKLLPVYVKTKDVP
jgi:tRNA threonylcarbamoyladenosine biosynthesis protein TsaB